LHCMPPRDSGLDVYCAALFGLRNASDSGMCRAKCAARHRRARAHSGQIARNDVPHRCSRDARQSEVTGWSTVALAGTVRRSVPDATLASATDVA
jgi:hypothetical protein